MACDLTLAFSVEKCRETSGFTSRLAMANGSLTTILVYLHNILGDSEVVARQIEFRVILDMLLNLMYFCATFNPSRGSPAQNDLFVFMCRQAPFNQAVESCWK